MQLNRSRMEMAKKQYSASVEDYLEAIYNIVEEKQGVRAKDIAKRLNVSNASVTGALKHLKDNGLVNYAPYDVITLTEDGKLQALSVIKRHTALSKFFVDVLALKPEVADEEACKVEHTISNHVLERLVGFMQFAESDKTHFQKGIAKFHKQLADS